MGLSLFIEVVIDNISGWDVLKYVWMAVCREICDADIKIKYS